MEEIVRATNSKVNVFKTGARRVVELLAVGWFRDKKGFVAFCRTPLVVDVQLVAECG
jgi:hypothetical protein